MGGGAGYVDSRGLGRLLLLIEGNELACERETSLGQGVIGTGLLEGCKGLELRLQGSSQLTDRSDSLESITVSYVLYRKPLP